jgi:hypothetical protein
LTSNVELEVPTAFITLGLGVYEVSGVVHFDGNAAVTSTLNTYVSNTTSLPATSTIAVPDATGQITVIALPASVGSSGVAVVIPTYRVQVTSGTVVLRLLAKATFTGTSLSVNGMLRAVRIA